MKPVPFSCDKDRGIEDQSLQGRSSTPRPARSSRSSFAHFGSRGFVLRAALTAAPSAAAAGADLRNRMSVAHNHERLAGSLDGIEHLGKSTRSFGSGQALH